jgi:hypothetical protein
LIAESQKERENLLGEEAHRSEAGTEFRRIPGLLKNF